MASSCCDFNKWRKYDQRTRDIVNGYIHEIQKVFPMKQNPYYNMPDSIHRVCLSFYWIAGIFNRDKYGESLKFIDDKVVEKNTDDEYALCSVGGVISKGESLTNFSVILNSESITKDKKDKPETESTGNKWKLLLTSDQSKLFLQIIISRNILYYEQSINQVLSTSYPQCKLNHHFNELYHQTNDQKINII